jgi:hypothetical protein
LLKRGIGKGQSGIAAGLAEMRRPFVRVPFEQHELLGMIHRQCLSMRASMRLKIAVFAPIPSASVNTAIAVNPGFFANIRSPYRASCQSVCITSFL